MLAKHHFGYRGRRTVGAVQAIGQHTGGDPESDHEHDEHRNHREQGTAPAHRQAPAPAPGAGRGGPP